MRKAVLLLALLVPTMLLAHPDPDKDRDRHCKPKDRDCVSVPEGGSPFAYLALSGAVVIGLIATRRRRQVY